MTKRDISHLLRKGISDLKVGSAGLSLEEAKRKYGLTEIIKLASNENPLGPSPKATQTLKAVAEEANIYPDPTGYGLRMQLADLYGVGVDQVLHANGSSELITFAGEAFINEGDECIIPEPTYHRYQEISRIMGSTSIFCPIKDYRIDLEDMAKKVTPKTKLVIIANPNNPTADIVTHQEAETFLNKIGNDIIVVFDEAYGEYVDDPKYPDTLDFVSNGYNVVIFRTFSKAYGLAGARAGYAISSPEIIRVMNAVRPVFNVNRLAQLAAIEALKDRDHLNKCVRLVWEEKEICYNEFKNMGLFFMRSAANFIFVNIGVDDLKLHEAMVKRGIIIRPMTAWGYKGFIRVTIGTHYQNEKMLICLKEALEEIKQTAD